MVPGYSIMNNNISLTIKEGIKVSHLDVGNINHRVEQCKFRHHNYHKKQQILHNKNP